MLHQRYSSEIYEIELNKGKWSKMTLRYKTCLFDVKHVEDTGIKVDRAELMSPSI